MSSSTTAAIPDVFQTFDSDDIKEFESNNERDPGYAMHKDKSVRHTNSFTQYARIGKALLPTTPTVGVIPTGCYKPIYIPNKGIAFEPQTLYTDRIMRLPDSKSEEVINEIDRFWTLREKYSEFGLSFKRGFLLHGPPGSGKSCTIALIVSQMIKQDGIVLFGDNPDILGLALKAMREIEPLRKLTVVIEDIDTVIQQHRESSLLSLLDGEMQVDNVVFIATTNYPETLDQRITNRPSRFDKIIKIDVPNEASRRMYLENRLPGKNVDDLVANSVGFSIAHMRELIVATQVFGHSLEETVERLKKMKFTPKSTQNGNKIGLSGSDN